MAVYIELNFDEAVSVQKDKYLITYDWIIKIVIITDNLATNIK